MFTGSLDKQMHLDDLLNTCIYMNYFISRIQIHVLYIQMKIYEQKHIGEKEHIDEWEHKDEKIHLHI